MALASISVHVVEQAPQNGYLRCLCLPGELKLPPSSPEESPRSTSRSGPGSFQITASDLGHGTCEILCVPFRCGVSISHSPLGLLKVSPADLQRQMFWGLIFSMLDSWDGKPNVGLRPLTP